MTSYVMCNKKKLGIKKSDIECLKKSVEDRKLEYFKSELLKILDKKEKEESGEEVSKAFIVQDLYKSMTDPLYMAKGGKVGVVGEIRTWNGKKYKKMPNKKWVRVYDKETRGAKLSIAALRRKIDACTNSQELLNLVLANKDRFCDELGRPLPIVQELSKYVSKKNDELETLPTGRTQKEHYADQKALKRRNAEEYNKKRAEHIRQDVELNKVAYNQELLSRKEAEKIIAEYKNKKLTNKETSLNANYGSEGAGKLVSRKAVNKSVKNGFTEKEHFTIASHIKEIFEEANLISIEPDRDSDLNDNVKEVRRYATEFDLNGKKGFALMTVKLNKDETNKMYALELNYLTNKKPATSGEVKDNSNHATLTKDKSRRPQASKDTIAQDYNDVNKKDKTLNPGEFGTTQEMLDKYNVKLIDSVDNWAVFEQNGEYGYIHNGKAVRQWHKTADEVKEIIKQKADEEKKKIEESERIEKDAIKQLGEEKYKSLFDYAAKYYDNLAKKTGNTYGNARIKEVILNAIDKINKKDWEFEELVRRSDNKVSRKVFETLTGIDLGTNEKAGTAAWEKWCGKENVEARRKQQQELKDAEKAKEEAEKKAALEAEHKEYNGFLDGKTAAYKGKAKQILDKKYRYDGKVMSFQELADEYIKNGGHVFSNQNYSKTKTYYYVNDSQGRGYEVPKIVYDYAKHIQENGILEKSFTSRINELKKSFFDSIGA